MRSRSQLHPYQANAVDFVKKSKRTALLLDLSLGKTIVTLTAISDLLIHGQIYGALIIAPRRVAETVWHHEAMEWEHTAWLRICVLRGANKNLITRNLVTRYHIHVINYEALPWLTANMNRLFFDNGLYLPWDMIVFDESTRIKNSQGKRVRQLYPFLKEYNGGTYFPRRVALTGTPAPNGYIDLFGQYLALDNGRVLGSSLQAYKDQYFIEDSRFNKAVPAGGAKEQIHKQIRGITLSLRAKDYLTLPPVRYNYIIVDLPPKVRRQYDSLESAMFAEMDHGKLEVFNAASLTTKCRQLANGNLIDTASGEYHHIHNMKLEALDDIIEESAGKPVLVPYQFRSDMQCIMDRYTGKRLNCAYIGPGVSGEKVNAIVRDWNAQRYHLMTSHPQSIGHGMNLQFGSYTMAWFGQTFNLEHWLQMNGRLARQGQPNPYVIINVIMARDTVDEAVRVALDCKTRDQDGLRAALNDYRETKRNRTHERTHIGHSPEETYDQRTAPAGLQNPDGSSWAV